MTQNYQSKKLVSILIPAYNNPIYTRQTLNSIIQQSYRPLEVILIDDNSPVSLQIIFDEFSRKKDRLIQAKYYRNKKNLKPFFNMKSGLNRVSGKYLILMPHDDWFVNNNFIETSVQYMEKSSVCFVVIGNSQIEGTNKKMFSHNFLTDPFELNGKQYLTKYLFKEIHPAYSAVLMNFEKLKELNYYRVLMSEQEANFLDIKPDEAYVSIALLSEAGSVLVSNEISSVRGNPKESYSKSEEWKAAWSLGVFFPYYKILINFINVRAYRGAFAIFCTIINGKSTTFKQIYAIFKKLGFRPYLFLLYINKIYSLIKHFIKHPGSIIRLITKDLKKIFCKIRSAN